MIDLHVYSSSGCNWRNINLKLIYDCLKREYEGKNIHFYWHDTGTFSAAEAAAKYGPVGALPSVVVYKDRDFRYCRAGGVGAYDEYKRALEDLIKE